MKWHSEEYREQVVKFSEDHSIRKACERFGISMSLLCGWRKRKKKGEGLANKKPDRAHMRKIPEHELQNFLDENPDAFQKEIAHKFRCSVPAVHYAIRNFGYKLKKSVDDTEKPTRWHKQNL